MSAVLFSALFIFPSNLLCQEVSEAGTKNSGSTSENQNTKYTEYQNAVMFYILIPPYKAYGKDYPFLQREFMENCGIASPNETLEQIRGDLTIDEAKLELQWINDLWIKIKKVHAELPDEDSKVLKQIMATTITLLNLEIIVLRTLTLDSNKYEEGREKLESIFPGLANGSYEILAPPMPTDERKEYEEEGKLPPNCFSNALGIQTHAVDPVSGLVDAYSSPYQTLDKWFTEDRNFSPRSEYSSDNLLDYPPGTVLIYEGSLNDQHPLFGLFPNAQIPTHAATLTDNGVWYSVTGPGGVHLLHANAEDFSGGIIGKPKYVYQPLPLQK